MFPAEFDYFAPRTIDEALTLLATYGDEAKVLAGGQSLVPMMKLRIAAPRYIVDINRIEALHGLRQEGDRVVCGALCRHAEVAASPMLRARLPLMVDAAEHTADAQVRNRGTVGGGLSHADPAGDWPAALLALEADVTVTGRSGLRTVPLLQFILDAYTTLMAHDEILTQVSVPLPPPRSGGAYVKFERRAGDFAVASAGVQLTLTSDQMVRHAAVSIGAVGAIPIRARAVEALLAGPVATPRTLTEAERVLHGELAPLDDTRGSPEYKRHLAGVLFRDAYAAALARARQDSPSGIEGN